jgi:hypothetical protein
MFILRKDISSREPKLIKQAFVNYFEYIEELKDKFPKAALEFATAEWHYNPENHRCLHDSWLESLSIDEVGRGSRFEIREVSLKLRLFGAYHDGYTELVYSDLRHYEINLLQTKISPHIGHGDWLDDEIRLSSDGYILHEIEFSSGKNWRIESKGFEHSWKPL